LESRNTHAEAFTMRSFLLSATTLLLGLGCSGPESAATPPGSAEADPPTQVQGGAPAVDGATPPSHGRITAPSSALGDDEGIELSGTMAYLDDPPLVGTVRLEVMTTGDDGEATLLVVEDLEGLGPWSVRVPEDLGPVNLLAYVDAEMNGPNPGEPSSNLIEPITVAKADISGIELVLSANEPVPEEDLVKQQLTPDGMPIDPDGDQVFVTLEDLGNPDAPQPTAPPEAPPEPAPAEEAPAE
jgi:hypothetical protein